MKPPHPWAEALAWDAEAQNAGERRRVLVRGGADGGVDLLDEGPGLAAALGCLLHDIRDTPYLDWLLMTSQPGNLGSRLEAVLRLGDPTADFVAAWADDMPLPNVWLGTTLNDQSEADGRLPDLMLQPARVRFVLCPPDCGLQPLGPWLDPRTDQQPSLLHWLILEAPARPARLPPAVAVWSETHQLYELPHLAATGAIA